MNVHAVKYREQQSQTLHRHMQMIVQACLELFGEPVAIILYGSYGRGEGAWYKDGRGNWQPYNDYDLRVVTRSKTNIQREHLECIEVALSNRIGIKWIDISQCSCQELASLRPSILNHDFKYGSRVIYGDADILSTIPAIDASLLPMKEAQILYFTRLYTLIGSLAENEFSFGVKEDAARYFRYQMAKGILAVIDALLLLKGAYHTSYLERWERLCRLYPEKDELSQLGEWAVQEKLRPRGTQLTSSDVYKLYSSVQRHFTAEMYRALSVYYGRTITGPRDIERCVKWSPNGFLKRIFWLIKYRDWRMERRWAISLAQSYLAAAWEPDDINQRYLSRAIKLLRQVDPKLDKKLTWDQARLMAARLRMEA